MTLRSLASSVLRRLVGWDTGCALRGAAGHKAPALRIMIIVVENYHFATKGTMALANGQSSGII